MRLFLVAAVCLLPSSVVLAGDPYGNRVDRNFVPPLPPAKSFTTYRTYDLGPSPTFSRPSSSSGSWRMPSSGNASNGARRARPDDDEHDDNEALCAANKALACFGLGYRREQTGRADAAVSFYDKSCSLGMAEGCMKAGLLYESGKAGRKDLVRAAQAFRRACDGGQGQACFFLSSCYEEGTCGILRKSLSECARLEAKACALGFGPGCTWEGIRLLRGEGVAANLVLGREKLEGACAAKVGSACYALGTLLYHGDRLPRDKVLGRRFVEQACQLKDQDGCTTLHIAELEEATPGTNPTGFLLLKLACQNRSDPNACAAAGAAHLNGKVTEPDLKEALGMLTKACDAGHLMGCVNLGQVYWKGFEGLPADHARALRFAQKACDGGLAIGCNNVAWYLLKGQGIQRDPARALSLLQKTDAAGGTAAADSLGDVYAEGLAGVAVDRARAREYYHRACAAGFEGSCAKEAALTPPRRPGRKSPRN